MLTLFARASVKDIRAAVAISLAVGALFLTACTSGQVSGPSTAPEPLPTAEATPKATADPTVTGVIIGGRAFTTVDEAGAVLDTVEYTGDPEAAMDVLSDAFGAVPELRQQATDNNCVPAAWIAVWNDAVYLTYDAAGLPNDQAFAVTAAGSAVNEVAVTTPGGVAVGGSLADLQTSVPDAHSVHHDFEGVVYDFVQYEVGAGEWVDPSSEAALSADYWGARADVIDGVITHLTAPVWYFDFC